MIRKATMGDMPQILEIYDDARKFMAANGNPTQWGASHPEQTTLEKDIADGVLYVIAAKNNNLNGVFAFIIGEDETYGIIDEGNWHYNETYGTIHRLAAKNGSKGIFATCVDFCKSIHGYIRIDTHADNHIMQYNIQKAGFERCGIIYAYDGSPRIAYDKKF